MLLLLLLLLSSLWTGGKDKGQGQRLHKNIIIGIEVENGIYHKERKDNNQNKRNVFYVIFKIYWPVKSDVLMEALSRSAELLIFDLEPLVADCLHGLWDTQPINVLV